MKLYVWLLLLAFGASACQLGEQKIRINSQSTVLYKGGVTQTEAQRLGNFLVQQGYFNTYDERKVRVRKADHIYTVTFMIDGHHFNEEKANMVTGFAVWRSWLQEQVFPSATVVVKLTDSRLQVVAVIDSSTHRSP